MHARDDNAARDDIRTYRSAELPACTEELQMGNAFCNDAPRLRREELGLPDTATDAECVAKEEVRKQSLS